MNYQPLIERELRVAVRRRGGGYGLRLLCAAASTIAAFGLLFIWSAWRPGAGFGRPFLQTLAGGGFLIALLTGMVLAADALSREKREGTLDLLLLTDLRIGDVVLGKLFASMVIPVYGFLAVVPMLEISVIVGGTTIGECLALLVVWINALFFSLAASLLVSSTCQEQRHAHAGTVLTVLLLVAGLPLLGQALVQATGSSIWFSVPLLLSPTGPYQFAAVYPAKGTWFWAALLLNQAVAWTFLGLAKRALIGSRIERAEPKDPPHLAQAAAEEAAKKALERHSQHAHLLEGSPIQWLLARRLQTPWALWMCSLAAMVVVARYGANPFGGGFDRFGFVALAIAHVVLKLAIATEAAHCLATDQRSGALESLLATEISLEEITSGIAGTFRRRVTGPVLLLAAGTLLAAAGAWVGGSVQGAMFLTAAGLILPLESYALFWIGLFQGLAARNAAVALATATFEIVLLPWAWFLMARGLFWNSSPFELFLLWIVLSVVNHSWFLSHAKTHLFRHFRTLALKPFGGKNPPMESQWSAINWEEESCEA